MALRPKRVAKTPEEKAFDKCEKLYPKLAYGRCCINCLSEWRVTPATQIHHIIRRNCLHLRFDPQNLVPLCFDCHRKIHDGKLTEAISEEHRERLHKLSLRDTKAVCLLNGITKEELYLSQYEKMKQLLLT